MKETDVEMRNPVEKNGVIFQLDIFWCLYTHILQSMCKGNAGSHVPDNVTCKLD